MTTDDLRTRAREAAERYAPMNTYLVSAADTMTARSAYYDGFRAGYLAHAAQLPSREQIARAISDAQQEEDTADWAAQSVLTLIRGGRS